MTSARATNSWVDTSQSSNLKIFEKANNIIKQNIYCTLATSSSEGIPWSTPVYFSYDKQCHIYWTSTIQSQHSQNIYQNQGQVALSIFNSIVPEGTSVQGLYFFGKAMEVTNDLLPFAAELSIARANNYALSSVELQQKVKIKVQNILSDNTLKMYQFIPQSAWITGERLAVREQLIDTKITINLKDFLKFRSNNLD